MTSRLGTNQGHLLIDHRASPGTPLVPSGTIMEAATFTCCHCNGVVVMHPQRQRARNVCRKCMRQTCDTLGCVTECNPILQAVGLAQRYPDSGQPFLLRGPRGEILFDPAFKEREKVF